MKVLCVITLLLFSFLTITGEAALANPIHIIAVNNLVNFTLNISGDIPTAATIYFFEGTAFDFYQENVDARFNPTYVSEFSAPVGGEGITAASARYTKADIDNFNNAYFEIFADADNWMIGRFGESPGFTLAYEGEGLVGDIPVHEYTSSATIKYENGYIAPFHSGPDPTPEPTSGLLVLVGSAFLILKRRGWK